jgi:hypothetical protein
MDIVGKRGEYLFGAIITKWSMGPQSIGGIACAARCFGPP